ACIGEMKGWLKKDHSPIFLLDMVDAKTVSEALLAEHRLEWLLMDWTWKTNYHGMLAGAVGPVGLHVDEATGLPTMRFLPVVFMASETEDSEAPELLLQAYFEIADRLGISTTRAAMDCRCMGAAAPLCKARGIRLRGCLQRAKGNVADEGKKMLDKGGGVKRMKNTALVHPIKNFMEFSSGLPDSGAGGEGESDLEFNVPWTEIFDRLREDGEESFQWGESAMADYLLTNIFTVRPDGTIAAPRRCGLGQAPPGLATYATSRSWRTLKGVCCAGAPKSLPELIDGIGAVMTSRKDAGFWKSLHREIKIPPPSLTGEGRRRVASRHEQYVSEGGGGATTRPARLNRRDMMPHFQREGRDGAHLSSACDVVLNVDGVAAQTTSVHVLLRFHRSWAKERKADVPAALQLGTATSFSDVREAARG
ncbi:unnamed protein product, partial [Prorocentrum cordatum]